MRQVFLDKNNIAVKEICQPHLDDNNILVKVHYSFLGSGAELATIEKAQESLFFSNVPNKIKNVIKSVSQHGIDQTANKVKNKIIGKVQPLGYSCSGEIIAIGKDVKNFREGDLVACAGASFAKHADVISMPQHLVAKVKNKEILKETSLTTIGVRALQSVRRTNLQIGENVCVIGLGVLGQLTVQMAKLSGCNVIGIDILKDRLDLAKKLGAISTFHSTEDNVINEIEYLTDHHGADCTIITAASKSDAIIDQAIAITRKKGKIIIVSDIGLHLNPNPFYKKEIELVVSCSHGPGTQNKDYPYEVVRWTEQRNIQEFIKLIEHKKINTQDLITDNININNIESAYKKLKNRESLGIIINYKKTSKVTSKSLDTNNNEIRFIPARKDIIRVGILGAGKFSKENLLPIIAQQKEIQINAIADKNVANSLHISKMYGATQSFANYDEFLKKETCDTIVISSEHTDHCQQALQAMNKGKAVFLEKPMATNSKELEQIQTFLTANPNIPFCVDYSRSFSPFIQKIKRTIKNRKSPLVINYRMNVELQRKNLLVQEDMGSGRIIGEACSIFDIFYFLTESRPISVSVESLNTTNSQLFPTDNFCAQISFQDGSICSLTYTSLGHEDMGRERMEVFFDSKSIEMKDYKILRGFGLRKSFDECSEYPDKGRNMLISKFFTSLKNKNKIKNPIGLQRLYDIANLTIIVDKLACQGGGEKTV